MNTPSKHPTIGRCPWCSEPGLLFETEGFYCIECPGCAARGPVVSVDDSEEDEAAAVTHAKVQAIESWNRKRNKP